MILDFLSLDYAAGFGGKYGVQKDRVDQVFLRVVLGSLFANFGKANAPSFSVIRQFFKGTNA